MQRRALLTLVPAALLAGCGFRLRGVPEFAFGSLFIAAQPGSPLALELQRTLEGAGGPLKVLRDPAALPTAEAVLGLARARRAAGRLAPQTTLEPLYLMSFGKSPG